MQLTSDPGENLNLIRARVFATKVNMYAAKKARPVSKGGVNNGKIK